MKAILCEWLRTPLYHGRESGAVLLSHGAPRPPRILDAYTRPAPWDS